MSTTTMTNAQLDRALDAETEKAMLAGLDTTATLDALFEERKQRIAALRQANLEAEEAFLATLVPAVPQSAFEAALVAPTAVISTLEQLAHRASTLRALRATVRPRADRGRPGLRPSGIFLVARFRIEDSARRLAELVDSLDGVAHVAKTHKAKHTGDLTWRVDFTIDEDADLYIQHGKQR